MVLVITINVYLVNIMVIIGAQISKEALKYNIDKYGKVDAMMRLNKSFNDDENFPFLVIDRKNKASMFWFKSIKFKKEYKQN